MCGFCFWSLESSESKFSPFSFLKPHPCAFVFRRRKLPVCYYEFAGEGHGFRQALNIRRCAELELSFYAQVFGFELAGAIERADIENL